MMKVLRFFQLWLVAAILLAACGQPGAPQIVETPTPPESETPQATPLPAEDTANNPVEMARQALAQQLQIDPAEVEVKMSDPAEWPDSCLGLAQPGEVCTDAITLGFGGMLAANEQQFEFRVDESGKIVRFIPGAALSARQVLAQQQQLDLDAIRFLRVEPVQWRDACLGVQHEGTMCAQVITPGYQVSLQAGGNSYVYHTDETGATVILAEGPAVQMGEALIRWQDQSQGACQVAEISQEGLGFGDCGSALMPGKFASDERVTQLAEFADTYAPFEASTQNGSISFRGQGSQVATPAEQRMIAEWARLATLETMGGRSGASWGLAFAWHREGGIAGFCDDLAVYITGEVFASSCKGNQPVDLGRTRLDAVELEKLYTWVDRYESFEMERKDPATADAMAIRLVFSGNGQQQTGEAERSEILDFAAQLYTMVSQGVRRSGDPADKPIGVSPQVRQARIALESYFTALNEGRFADAAKLYGGSYENLMGNNPSVPPEDHAGLLEAGCTYNGFRCDLTLRQVLNAEQLATGGVKFTVEFSNPDGTLFEQGPCCGADPATTPVVTRFEYTVLPSGNQFLVQELPIYIP